ncbi:DUF3630 family protein [Vibrio sp. HB161653]|uniref:DUF3630 family protein n=1 Tax=Vibrio sp. HB236076 TaxID=3232307 RepID=A0AB39HDM7_9VIBR|nr:DUF3630 family protein [Vibrio sp. HB161653]MDP5255811.1 DUF3630 family protein [Vibrio sp. HB161653]
MHFGLERYQLAPCSVVLSLSEFDFDRFPQWGEVLLAQLPATLIEAQLDGDLHSWLIDFEDCRLLLKAEHYSEAVWLEPIDPVQSQAVMDYLAQLFERGFHLVV